MRKFYFLLISVFFITVAFTQDRTIVKGPRVITGHLIKVTKPVKEFRKEQSLITDIKVRDEDGIIGEDEYMEELPEIKKFNKVFKGDEALQKQYPNLSHHGQNSRIASNSFNGMDYSMVTPADPSIAAGPNHIIQMINGASGAMFTMFDKSGVQLVAPVYLDNITGNGGLGDPIVLYDHLADRFIMTEFVNKNETGSQGLSIAVSQTNDPTGSWFVYFFSTGSNFPDYPKFSVWPDAYYAKTNDFNTTNNYIGSSVYAFDRSKMLAGNSTAGMQIFTTGSGYKDYSISPVTLEGTSLPSTGTGGLFAYLQEDVWSGSNTDSIGLIEFKVDFNNSSNSALISRSSLAVASYSSSVCGASRSQCISQPGTTIMLEALDQRIMNQPVYRNFGNYEGIVLTNVVNNGSNISALRWYELSKTTTGWGIKQQSTFSPDNNHRFMPAICYDSKGNIALAYNISSGSTYPGIRYTARKQCDPLNTMTYAESSLADGTASNLNSRYGDYSHLVCDPDGKTFWFTGMYNNSSHWSTRISSFILDTCTTVCGIPSGVNTTNITSNSATLNWTTVTNGSTYSVDYKADTSSTWISAAAATASVSFNLTGLSASTLYDWRVKTNCLNGTSSYASSQFTTTALSCNAPVTLSVSNVGSTSVTLSWTAASNALSYSVDYQLNSSTTWINITSSTTSLSFSLTGLSPGTLYNWRVRTNCQGGYSAYNTSRFTTTSTLCNIPTSLTASSITISGAKLSWAGDASTSKYAVDYKKTTTTTWTSASSGTTSLSVTLSSLTAGTVYDWRVKTICSTTSSSSYSTAQFTTIPICPDQLESNNTLSTAKPIPVGVNILAQIASTTDLDYYSFTNSSSQNNIKLTLTNLPANYDMKLFSSSGTLLASSTNSGTTNETINYNTNAIGTYIVEVYGYNKAYSNTSCYTLKVITGASAFAPEIYRSQILSNSHTSVFNVYPVPAFGEVTVAFNENSNDVRNNTTLVIEDQLGKTIFTKKIAVKEGENYSTIDVSNLPNGVYFIKLANSKGIRTRKLVVAK